MRRTHRTYPDRRSCRLAALAGAASLLVPGAVEAAALPPVPTGPATGTADAPGSGTAHDTTDAADVRTVPLEDPTLTFPTPEDPDRPVMVLDDGLEDRMRAMADRSPRWAAALGTLRRERFPVLVGSITQVEAILPELERYRFDGMGATWIFADDGDRPVAAAVTLNLPKLVIRNRLTGGDAEQLRRMLELHLAHEIYGHLLPIVRSRELDHPCAADPDPAAPVAVQLASCVMERESEILRDLGYEPREAYHWHFWDERIELSDPAVDTTAGDGETRGPGRRPRPTGAPGPPGAGTAPPAARPPPR